jgi:DNA-binding MarR family transcriptional regulator
MASEPLGSPVLQVFGMIRLIDNGVREQIAESLPEGLSVSQYEMMRLFDFKGDGMTPAEIAQTLHMPKSGVTAILQRLEASGYVRVEPCPDDGRRKRVWLTDAGRKIYVTTVAAIRPKMEKLREAFTMEEFREALPFLRALQTWFAERDWA